MLIGRQCAAQLWCHSSANSLPVSAKALVAIQRNLFRDYCFVFYPFRHKHRVRCIPVIVLTINSYLITKIVIKRIIYKHYCI